MGRFFLRLLATLAFAFIATASWASCPYGTAFADGCSAAPTASADTVQQPNFFTGYARQNGQTYSSSGACTEPNCHPPWNVAGVDYPVGINASYAGNLKDPATAPLPTGCSFFGGSQPYVRCGNVNNLNISGYDFGHSVAGSVQLDIAGGVTGTLTISNDKFFNGPAVDSEFFAVIIYNTNSANVVFDYNYLDGNGLAIPAGKLATMVADQSTGSLTFQYNAMINLPSKAILYSTNSSVNISYNYGDGLNYGSSGHSEFTIGGPATPDGTMSSVEIGYNTFLTDSNNGGATANIYLSDGSIGGTVLEASVDHDVLVSNMNPSPIVNGVLDETAITSSYLVESGGQEFDSVNFIDNYFDPSGSFGCIGDFANAIAETIAGNVNMLDGSTVSGPSCRLVSGGGSSGSGEGTLSVPEPPTWALLLIAWAGIGYSIAWRRNSQRACQQGRPSADAVA